MIHRIACTGASGTGKTTAAKFLSEKLGIPLCPVGSRSVSEAMGLKSPYQVDALGRRSEFQRMLRDQKSEWEDKHRNTGFVTDRTHFDSLAYHTLHAVHEVSRDDIEDAKHANLIYTDVLAFWSVEFINCNKDPQRIHELTYHQIFEMLCFKFFDDWHFKSILFVPGYDGDLEKRKEFLIDSFHINKSSSIRRTFS